MYSLHWVTPTGLNKTDGWARCVGEWREREWLRSLILLKPPSGRAHLLSFSAFPTFYVDVTGGLTVRTCLCAVFAPKVDLQEYYHAHMWYCCDFRCTRPLPGSSSHERSSELMSARLGVRLRSSESESASSTLTTLLWLWESGSGDAPRSNSKKTPNMVYYAVHLCSTETERMALTRCVGWRQKWCWFTSSENKTSDLILQFWHSWSGVSDL